MFTTTDELFFRVKNFNFEINEEYPKKCFI